MPESFSGTVSLPFTVEPTATRHWISFHRALRITLPPAPLQTPRAESHQAPIPPPAEPILTSHTSCIEAETMTSPIGDSNRPRYHDT